MARSVEADRALIESALGRHGLRVDKWGDDGNGNLVAEFDNLWTPVEEDEDRGLYLDALGKLTAQAVGAPDKLNNLATYNWRET